MTLLLVWFKSLLARPNIVSWSKIFPQNFPTIQDHLNKVSNHWIMDAIVVACKLGTRLTTNMSNTFLWKCNTSGIIIILVLLWMCRDQSTFSLPNSADMDIQKRFVTIYQIVPARGWPRVVTSVIRHKAL